MDDIVVSLPNGWFPVIYVIGHLAAGISFAVVTIKLAKQGGKHDDDRNDGQAMSYVIPAIFVGLASLVSMVTAHIAAGQMFCAAMGY